MNVRYSLGDYTLKVLGCDKSLDVLDFYYRNRNDFDIYESDKPEAFYTEEFIKNIWMTLSANLPIDMVIV